jgi:hypothetical protein
MRDLDEIVYGNMTDRALIEEAKKMVVSQSFSESARRAVVYELRRRGLTKGASQ